MRVRAPVAGDARRFGSAALANIGRCLRNLADEAGIRHYIETMEGLLPSDQIKRCVLHLLGGFHNFDGAEVRNPVISTAAVGTHPWKSDTEVTTQTVRLPGSKFVWLAYVPPC